MSLAKGPEDLRGLRAARWIRESTPGQFDRYGPDTQNRLIGGALARLGLVDTGLVFSVARSGATVYRDRVMRDAIDAGRAGRYDILVVAYVDRWQRNLQQTLNVLEDELHPTGVAVWFCDEELLSSCERHWGQLVDLAKAADLWLRVHRRRVQGGLADKLATKRDPGGHPPIGFRRNEAKLVEPDPEALPVVRRVVELSAAGLQDRPIAAETGLSLYLVRGILTSPLYVGRLRDGKPANWGALVDLELWNRAQANRAARAMTAGRPASPRRSYALSMLRCSSCGRRLIGDTGYYRHNDVCAAFAAATPDWPANWHGRRDGKGYQRGLFEAAIGQVLERVSLGAETLTRVVGLVSAPPASPDRLVLARIEKDRETALARYRRDRDSVALDTTMANLDRDEAEARRPRQLEGVPAEAAVRFLGELATTWRRADGGVGRRMLAEALFESIDAQGFREATLRLTNTAIAHGFAAVIPQRLELTVGYGRGERFQDIDFVLMGRGESAA